MSKKYGEGRTVWRGQSWSLQAIPLLRSDGTTVEKGVIEHPGSVVIVPIQDNQVLMLHQYRPALDRAILELPAGTREGEEDWLVCAQRELREETGYRAESWLSLGQVWPAPGITNELMTAYLATELSPAPLPADEDEEIELRPMPLGELENMAIDGRLQDAKSVVGILRAAAYLRSAGPAASSHTS